MKKFFKSILLFLLPFVCVIASLEIWLRHIPNTYTYKYEWMQNNAEDVEVLVLGSSHTFNGIRTSLFNKKAFNLANYSQKTEQDAYFLLRWSGKYKRLKTVIFPISYATLFYHKLENTNESYRCRYYKIYMDCGLYSFFSKYNIALYDIKIRIKLNRLKTLFEKKNELWCDKYGWGTAYPITNKDLNTWENADVVKSSQTAKDWTEINRNITKIKDIADFCQSHNIRLVLITTPCWHTYYNQLDKKQLDKMYELTYELQKEYNLQYLDYLKDNRFIADDFYDSSHLSDIGANKFTKILKQELNL